MPLVPVLAPLAAKVVERVRPEWHGAWARTGTWKVGHLYHGTGTIPKYRPSSSTYTEIGGVPVKQGESIRFTYIRTGSID